MAALLAVDARESSQTGRQLGFFKPFQGTPLFYRLLAALVIVGLIPTVPLFYLLFRYNQEVALERISQDLSQQVALLSSSFEQEYQTSPKRSLKQVASSEAMGDLVSGPLEERLVNAKSLEALFFNIAREHDVYSGLYFIDAQGDEVAAVVDRQRSGRFGAVVNWTTSPPDPKAPTLEVGRTLLKRLYTTPSLLAAGNMEWFMPPRDVLSEGPFLDEQSRLSMLLGLSTLDNDSGALSGAAIIRIDLSQFLKVLDSVRVLDENVAWLLDSTQQVLVQPDVATTHRLTPIGLMEPQAASQVRVVLNEAGVVAYRDLGVNGANPLLRLAYAVPDEVVAKEFRATRNLFAVALVVSLLASLVIAYFTSKAIARPITGLAATARSLSQGNLSARVDVTASGEVQVLVDSFNSMAVNLERSMQELFAQTLVIDKAPFGIMTLSPEPDLHQIRYVNEAFVRMLGYPQSNVLGQQPAILLASDTAPVTTDAVARALSQLAPTEVELPCQTQDGEIRLMRWLIFPCQSSPDEVISIVVFLTDVTDIRTVEKEREQLAAEIQESNKLEFLALTIAGISHDLNTPIGVGVTASTQLSRTVARLRVTLQQEPGNVEGLKNWCTKIEQAAEIIDRNLEKAGQLVQGFKKTTANATRTEWLNLNLRSLLDSLLVSLSPVMKRTRCTVNLDCPPGLQLYTEPGSVSQALTNLMINATVHAFDNIEARRIDIKVTDLGAEVLITVADNGNGMSEQAAVKAFTPFFTTKRTLGGSGLGLFSSRRVVEQVLGGRMSFDTHKGRGTVFLIHLPKTRIGAVLENA